MLHFSFPVVVVLVGWLAGVEILISPVAWKKTAAVFFGISFFSSAELNWKKDNYKISVSVRRLPRAVVTAATFCWPLKRARFGVPLG